VNLRISRGRALTTAAIAVGVALAVAVPAAAAVQLQSQSAPATIKIVKNAALKANGAGAVVTIVVNCHKGDRFYTDLTVSEKVGNRTTSGTTHTDTSICTGVNQRLKLGITASPKAFKAGTAFAIASISSYSPSGSGGEHNARAQREITLH
jgi:hypothetical protein